MELVATIGAMHVGVAGVGIIILLALILLLVALRPEREYADLPRGEFPRDGQPHPTRRASASEPPVRAILPEMEPAEAALIIREADAPTMLIATLVDLATRGFLQLVEYRYIPGSSPSIILIYLKPGDETCSKSERALLRLLAIPGAAESPDFARAYPFDERRFRSALEEAGIPFLGYATARVAGLRPSLSRLMGAITAQHLEKERGWLLSSRRTVAALGAIEFVLGGIGMVTAGVATLVGVISSWWILIGFVLAGMGTATVFLGAERSPDGSVARDQVVGFRRYIAEAPVAMGATLPRFGSLAAWALALDATGEWEASLRRLAGSSPSEVAKIFPWYVRVSAPVINAHDVTDFLALLLARVHATPESRSEGSRLVALEPESNPQLERWSSF